MNIMMCKYHPDNQAIFLLWNETILQFACEECFENQKKQENTNMFKQLSIRKALKEPDYFLGEFNLSKENRQLIEKIDNVHVSKLKQLIISIETYIQEIQISLSNLIDRYKKIIIDVIQKKENLRNDLEKVSFYALFKGIFQGLNSQQCITDDAINQIEDNIKQLFQEINKSQKSFNQEILKQLLIPKFDKPTILPQYQILKDKLQTLKDNMASLLIQKPAHQTQDPKDYKRDLKFSNIYKQSQIQVSSDGKVAFAEDDVWQVVLCEQALPNNGQISFSFKILKLHQFYCGICFRDRINKDYRGFVTEAEHGYYMICRMGKVYSHHDKEINEQLKGFPSEQGDIIEILVDMIEKTIRWTNTRTKKSFVSY
ncbi:unnamed protein product (macronuclear) [Paramecium tetraurelia]|uniref:Uncharacterized protein n=1 Tax=Paramecium tetraurelia TaxID=5888 RepID=A0BHA3_PARTE|nr:uncharacterized protein GSPATT00028955001 [Paramecium tetraurelia]CAK57920.1 unnamed protein product [Paramecium tetraurelia]|eukprot:XP_001425318.1 hypothetical protein (macronuclear) [Paramecium tetraurelia strain d4-2]